MRHFARMIGGESKRNGRAPIVADDTEARVAEMAVA